MGGVGVGIIGGMDPIESKETTRGEGDSKKNGADLGETLTPALSRHTGRGSQSEKHTVQVFWMAFWLAVVLVGAKLYHIRPPDHWGGSQIRRYVSDVAIVTAGDLLFAVG